MYNFFFLMYEFPGEGRKAGVHVPPGTPSKGALVYIYIYQVLKYIQRHSVIELELESLVSVLLFFLKAVNIFIFYIFKKFKLSTSRTCKIICLIQLFFKWLLLEENCRDFCWSFWTYHIMKEKKWTFRKGFNL